MQADKAMGLCSRAKPEQLLRHPLRVRLFQGAGLCAGARCHCWSFAGKWGGNGLIIRVSEIVDASCFSGAMCPDQDGLVGSSVASCAN